MQSWCRWRTRPPGEPLLSPVYWEPPDLSLVNRDWTSLKTKAKPVPVQRTTSVATPAPQTYSVWTVAVLTSAAAEYVHCMPTSSSILTMLPPALSNLTEAVVPPPSAPGLWQRPPGNALLQPVSTATVLCARGQACRAQGLRGSYDQGRHPLVDWWWTG